jgi:hypothetical protein
MKQKVTMLKTLMGVDDGDVYPKPYLASNEYEIGESLLRCFIELGGVELTGATAETRETKVTGPTEPKKPLHKMSKAELVAHGLSFGLELTPDSMTVKEMIAAIEAL